MSILKYRKFIFSLGQELSTENLSSLKYLLRDLLTTSQIEGINSPTDLFVLLEQRNELGSDNCHLLKDLLRQIKRQDLVRKLEDFKSNQIAEHNHAENDETVPRNGSVFAVNTEDMQPDCVDEGEQASAVSKSINENGSRSIQLAGHNHAGNDETVSSDGSVRAANKEEMMDCVADGEQAASAGYSVCESNGSSGRQMMLRDVSADIIEKLGFLLNPTLCVKNWIYLAGKLDYTYGQVSNYRLCPMQSTQMLLYDWATREDATVLKLYQVLMDIGRADAAKELELVLESTTPRSTRV